GRGRRRVHDPCAEVVHRAGPRGGLHPDGVARDRDRPSHQGTRGAARMRGRVLAFWAVALSILGVGLYGFLEGVPERDIVSAVRTGNLAEVKRLLERDPAL